MSTGPFATPRRAAGGKRFVHVSSLAAVGPNARPDSPPQDETTEPHPLPGYGASKLAAERIALEWADRLPVTVVRPPAVYGPRDTNFLPLLRGAQRKGIVPAIGPATKRAAFVYATDPAEGIYRAAAGAASNPAPAEERSTS